MFCKETLLLNTAPTYQTLCITFGTDWWRCCLTCWTCLTPWGSNLPALVAGKTATFFDLSIELLGRMKSPSFTGSRRGHPFCPSEFIQVDLWMIFFELHCNFFIGIPIDGLQFLCHDHRGQHSELIWAACSKDNSAVLLETDQIIFMRALHSKEIMDNDRQTSQLILLRKKQPVSQFDCRGRVLLQQVLGSPADPNLLAKLVGSLALADQLLITSQVSESEQAWNKNCVSYHTPWSSFSAFSAIALRCAISASSSSARVVTTEDVSSLSRFLRRCWNTIYRVSIESWCCDQGSRSCFSMGSERLEKFGSRGWHCVGFSGLYLFFCLARLSLKPSPLWYCEKAARVCQIQSQRGNHRCHLQQRLTPKMIKNDGPALAAHKLRGLGILASAPKPGLLNPADVTPTCAHAHFLG